MTQSIAAILKLAKDNHNAGNIAQAEELYRQVLRLTPASPPQGHVWYLLGAVYHAQGKSAEAVESFRQSIELRPDFPHAHYHMGIALSELVRHAEAEDCFRRALALMPGFAGCLAQLGHALAAQGKFAEAEEVYREALRVQGNAPHAAAGRIDNPSYNQTAPDTVGRIVNPSSSQAAPDTAVGRIDNPSHSDPALHISLAGTLFRQDKIDLALETFQQAKALAPASAEVHAAWATLCMGLGQADDAVAHLHEALRLQPDHAGAYGFLSELVKENCYRFSAAEIDNIRRLLTTPRMPAEDRIVLQFALAHALDKLGDYDLAFAHYRQGNELRHQLSARTGQALRAGEHQQTVADFIAGFTPEFFQLARDFGHPSEVPVFIVGMPRSGTTLVNQIISAHPAAATAGELAEMEHLVADLPQLLNQPRTIGLLFRLDRLTVQAIAERYLKVLRQFGGTAQRITDKMPQNYFYLGFIAAMFPRAHIIHCRRDPLDTCISCYTHNFADFSTSLEGLGFYYRQYEKLMAHWREALPIPMYEVQYEELVVRPEPIIRALIDFCGLPWHEACLAFHENRRAVHTVSRMQVRQPVYTGSVGRWQRYAAHLEPLRAALATVE
jgi:tetratricopeptide (TPR) repeat protein